MNVDAETVHVVSSLSAAGTLRTALPLLGGTGRVVGLADNLAVGPIDPPDADVRQAWAKSVLRVESMLPNWLDGDPLDIEQAWAEATAPETHPVVWTCRRSPMEHACLLAFAARMEGRGFDIIDATDLDFTTGDGMRPWSLGVMRARDFVASGLYGMRRPFSAAESQAASAAWSELRREDAPFRIVRDGRLVSAPLTHYDALLVGQASQDWEIAARLIGRMMGVLCGEDPQAGYGPGDSTGDVVLFGRMLALGQGGSLRIRGPGPGMRDYQVCRPAA